MTGYTVAPDYTWNIRINSFEVGPDRRLRLSNQLKLQQEVGELHLSAGGLSYDELYRHGMAFVLTRLHTVIHRAPLLGEQVRLRTWHRDSKRAQFFRCYQFLDQEGRTLIDSVTAFALVDVKDHKLLRPTVFEQFGLAEQPDRRGNCGDPAKLRPPAGLAAAGERTVHWSDIDCNGHLNNTVYADIACDHLPGGMEGKRIAEASIAFVHEAMEGNVLSLFAGTEGEEQPGYAGWVVGDLPDGRRCFEARIATEGSAPKKAQNNGSI